MKTLTLMVSNSTRKTANQPSSFKLDTTTIQFTFAVYLNEHAEKGITLDVCF